VFTQLAKTHPLPFKVTFDPRAVDSYNGIREIKIKIRELMDDYRK
jgi:hypothetical protein